MNSLKDSIRSFVETLIIYDYILFAISGALFIIILLLAILLRNKTKLSLILILLSLSIIGILPAYGYNMIHSIIFKTYLSELMIKKLEFTPALVIKGNLTNIGQKPFKKCTIESKVIKKSTNFIEEIANPLKPIRKMSMVTTENLDINDTIEFKMIIEPFTYSNEYNVTVESSCI